MKLLILTVTAGGGHNSMAKSVENYAKNFADVKIHDLFKKSNKVRREFVNKFYFFVSRRFLPLSNAFYRWIFNRNVNRKKHTFFHLLTKKVKPDILTLVKEYKPDVVFCAHTYCAHIMSEFRDKGMIDQNIKVFTATSDYEVSSYAELTTNVHYMIAPCDCVDDELLRRGFKREQILHLGIPTQTKFAEFIDKIEARKTIGVKEDKFTVMMMNGMIGFGNPVKLIKNLENIDKDFQIIIVCGRNEKLKAEIEEKKAKGEFKHEVYPFGFVNNVDVLMSASDCLIGKIGGLAIAEATNKRIPIIATTELPWQEYDNMVYLRALGACKYIDNPKTAYKVVGEVICNPKVCEEMVKNAEHVRKPNATKDIVDAMFECVREGKVSEYYTDK